MPKRLAAAMLAHAGLALDRTAHELSKLERARLIQSVKECELSISEDEGWDRAEVTAGGVSLEEVNPQTMESRVVPGLFLCGEILDLDGPMGGYNLQAAFSTGYSVAHGLNGCRLK